MKARLIYSPLFVACALALLVSGCVNAQIAALRERCDFSNDPRFSILKGKIPLSPMESETPPTLAEISNSNLANAAESRAILAFDEAGRPCLSEATRIASRAGGPAVVAILTNLRQKNLAELKRLAEGQISYGSYRQVSYSNLIMANRELAAVNSIAEANQQAAAASLIAAGNQMIDASRGPSSDLVTTNCRRVGQYLSCQSF